MRPVRLTIAASGNSQWVPLNYIQTDFALGLAVIPWSTTAGLTYVVQHTFDDLDQSKVAGNSIQISRVGTLATVFDPGPDGLGHGLSTNDNVIISGSGPPFDTPVASIGLQNGDLGADVTVTGLNTFTYIVPNSGPLKDSGAATIRRMRVFPHPVLNATASNPGATGLRASDTYTYTIRAVRLKALTLTAGLVDFLVLQSSHK